LFGAELEVHGWRCIDGEVHLRVRLADGSIGCVPAAWTNLLRDGQAVSPSTFLTLAALRNLRQLTEALSRRRAPRARGRGPSTQP
jgi:hypothetical protein